MSNLIERILMTNLDDIFMAIVIRICNAWNELFHRTPSIINQETICNKMEKVQLININDIYYDFEFLLRQLNVRIDIVNYAHCWYPYNWEWYRKQLGMIKKETHDDLKIEFESLAVELHKRGMVIENELFDPREFKVFLIKVSLSC